MKLSYMKCHGNLRLYDEYMVCMSTSQISLYVDVLLYMQKGVRLVNRFTISYTVYSSVTMAQDSNISTHLSFLQRCISSSLLPYFASFSFAPNWCTKPCLGFPWEKKICWTKKLISHDHFCKLKRLSSKIIGPFC